MKGGGREGQACLQTSQCVAVLSVPAEEEGPGGGPGRKGGYAGPPYGGGGHDSILPPTFLPFCIFALKFLLRGSFYQEEFKQSHCKDAQGTKQESLYPASFMHLTLSFT